MNPSRRGLAAPVVTVAAVTWVGVAAVAVCAWAAWTARTPLPLAPVALAALWWLAGTVVLVARPDHLSGRLLASVGLLHLTGFAVSAVVSVRGGGWPAWSAAVVGNLLFALGFVALATLLAAFPDERLRRRAPRRLAVVGVAAAVGVSLAAAVTSRRLDLALPVDRTALPPPRPLPWGPYDVDLSPALPLLVLGGLALLVLRWRRSAGDQRRQLLWPVAVACVLAVLLLATPVGTNLLGAGWALVFIPIVGGLPFALLAGLRRYRLLEVELYAGRTTAYAILVVGVLAGYAAAAAVAGRTGAVPAVVVAVVAAVSGQPLRRVVERRLDRVLTGGRVRGQLVVRALTESLGAADRQSLALRTVETVRSGLDVAWVVLRCPPDVDVRSGPAATDEAQVAVPLVAADQPVGVVECGPRRGGWSAEDVAMLGVLARHAALALRGASLATDLSRRVDELTASRARLVRAEDDVRRRIERDLHDGVQQQIVVLLGQLGMLRSLLDPDSPAGGLAARSHEQAARALDDLRSLVRGIHPALLTDRGLLAAVEAQVDLLPLPVSIDIDPRLEGVRFAAEVETAAYFVICEATTNVVKHAPGARTRIVLTPSTDGGLQVAVVDEGSGFTGTGSGSGTGSGLRGLHDRVEAVGGVLDVTSAAGVGTTVVAHFPAGVTVRA